MRTIRERTASPIGGPFNDSAARVSFSEGARAPLQPHLSPLEDRFQHCITALRSSSFLVPCDSNSALPVNRLVREQHAVAYSLIAWAAFVGFLQLQYRLASRCCVKSCSRRPFSTSTVAQGFPLDCQGLKLKHTESL